MVQNTAAGAAVPTTNQFPIEGYNVSACANSWGAPRSGGRSHQGDDCFAPKGTPLLAVENGRIEGSNSTLGGIGLWLIGDSGTGYFYTHNSVNLVSPGARVTKGQRIARVGNTGNAATTPPHVHFQIHPDGRGGSPVNAYPHLSKWATAPAAVEYSPFWVGMAPTKSGKGYWLAGRDGSVHSFGDAGFSGSLSGKPLSQPIVGMAADPDGQGYWLVSKDGGVFSFDAPFHGSLGGKALSKPIASMAARPTGKGYWLVAEDGGVFSFGDAPFKGSMGGKAISAPIKAIAAHPDGNGYWLAGMDGGVFSFGTAPFKGARSGKSNGGYVLGIAASKTGNGYWLSSTGGGVFSFGDAAFSGSAANKALSQPVLGMNADPDGTGYRLFAGDGGVFTFDTTFHGSGVGAL
jgi:hypothetical protein